ncbi:tripartite tricarboxylate transporter TctB family protein [Metabacillus halosaccharovorans]|uniref:tripartite tricarboxylate transporter TctB family protein n=1 Tax=Metabacillus halosaccharovorans TaxID=930124 RepID=UPI003735C897
MKDIISSIFIIILSITVFCVATPLGEGSSNLSSNASLFPQIISLFLGLLGVSLLIQAMIKTEKKKILFNKRVFIKVITLICILVVYVPALQILGYLLATIVFLFVVMVFLGQSIKKTSIHTVIISGSLYVIFALLFKVPLPTGIL